ncbi:MAG: 3-hydroxybutyryl-CoA dehydrogenase [Amylibacter sp.]|nr:3-hydroxybutyryl-CoA dehydrogenase [Amylibacter sp.]
MDIKSVSVIGAGQMGSGIAQVIAGAEFEVRLYDISRDALDKSLANITKNLNRAIGRSILTEDDRDRTLKNITTVTSLADCGSVDLVIEAATERESIKQAIFEDILPHIGSNTILTSNTSSISITRLASRTDRPEKFMGLHFMNPVPIMQLVELIRGIATDETTYKSVDALVGKIGKTASTSEDFPAFIVNRILMPMINEAIYTLYEGVGNVESIDTSLKLGANHPMGPLELADFIGLDTCLAIMNVLHDGLADTKYRPCPLLTKYVEAGWLGRKTKRGFYDYRGDAPVPTR